MNKLKKIKNLILVAISIIIFLIVMYGCMRVEKDEKFRSMFNELPIHREHKNEWSLDSSISDSIFDVIQKYPDLERTIKSGNVKLPTSESMIPQGIAYLHDEYIIITAYDHNGIDNSKCYVLNMVGEIVNEVFLDTKSHVGAIAYDKANNVFLIPDTKGVLNAYDEDDILNEDRAEAIQKFEYVGEGLINYMSDYGDYIDFMCLKDDYLFVGNFRTRDKGLVKKYKITKEDDEIVFEFNTQFNVPTLVQGITFYKSEDEEYMILSRSFGRRKKSKLEVYKYEEGKADYTDEHNLVTKMSLPPMLEQVTVDEDNLLLLFESNARKYADGKDKIDVLCILSLKKILDKSL